MLVTFRRADRLLPHWRGGLAVASVIFFTYLPVALHPYAYADDYAFLASAITRNRFTWNLLRDAGRPINGWVLTIGFGHAGGLEGLQDLRLIAVIGLGLLAAATFTWALRQGASVLQSGSLGLMICLLPSAQVIAAWTQLFTLPFVIVGTLFAWQISDSVVTKMRAGGRAWLLLMLSSAFLFTATLTYQPYVLFYAVFTIASMLIRPQGLKATAKWLFVHLSMVAVALSVGFVYVKSLDAPNPRSAIVTDLAGKLRWYFGEAIPHALNLFWLPPTRTVALPALVIVAVTVTLRLRCTDRRWSAVLVRWSFLLMLLGVASLAMLSVQENWASYRSLYPLAASIGVLCWAGMWHCVSRLSSLNLRRGASAVLLVSTALCVPLAQQHVTDLVIEPQMAEIAFVRRQLSAPGAEHTPTRIVVRRSSYVNSPAPFSLYDELGIPSTYPEYSADLMVWLVARDDRRDLKGLSRSAVGYGDADSETLVVDMRPFGRGGGPVAVP